MDARRIVPSWLLLSLSTGLLLSAAPAVGAPGKYSGASSNRIPSSSRWTNIPGGGTWRPGISSQNKAVTTPASVSAKESISLGRTRPGNMRKLFLAGKKAFNFAKDHKLIPFVGPDKGPKRQYSHATLVGGRTVELSKKGVSEAYWKNWTIDLMK